MRVAQAARTLELEAEGDVARQRSALSLISECVSTLQALRSLVQ